MSQFELEFSYIMELYIDNFKGFRDTIIPLSGVNFFVGENSTGKTAILNLLEVMSKPSFWIEPDFNPGEIELGYFSEMITQNCQGERCFAIGAYMDEEKDSDPYSGYIWIKFCEKESSPAVKEFRFITGNTSVWCYLEDDSTIMYQTKPILLGVSFSDWIHDSENYNDKQTLEIKYKAPFGIKRSMVEDRILGQNNEGRGRIIMPRDFNRFIWMAPIRAKAKRWYESYKVSFSPKGDHIPLFLKRYLEGSSKKVQAFVSEMNDFGKKSGLFDEIIVKNNDKETPFALFVKYGKLCVNINNVGYGVSQVLPLAVEMLTSKGDSFAIQQPEVHLHPKAQAAFGELIHKVATKYKNRIIIETHSDYLIDRFRYTVSKEKGRVGAQVVYFQRDDSGLHITIMPIDNRGQFVGDIPQSYMDFFFEEELKMLEM